MNNKACPYCNKVLGKGNINKHTSSCYLNPQNIKHCPICNNIIKTPKHNTTCSHSCANTFYRTGKNHGNWKEESYRSTCFFYHKKECVICKENNIVEVHHLDENSKNNNPNNLIPLCPTHHRYWHSRYKHLVEEQILIYVKKWSER